MGWIVDRPDCLSDTKANVDHELISLAIYIRSVSLRFSPDTNVLIF